MSGNVAAAFLVAVKQKLGLARDEDFAAYFGLAKSTIASWRARGTIPRKHISKIEQASGLTIEKFSNNELTRKPFFDWLVEVAFLSALSNAWGDLTRSERQELILRLVWRVKGLKEIASERIAMRIGNQDIIEAYLDVVADAFGGAFLDADDIAESRRIAPPYPLPCEVPQKVPQSAAGPRKGSSIHPKKYS